jgi:hypothetical protein
MVPKSAKSAKSVTPQTANKATLATTEMTTQTTRETQTTQTTQTTLARITRETLARITRVPIATLAQTTLDPAIQTTLPQLKPPPTQANPVPQTPEPITNLTAKYHHLATPGVSGMLASQGSQWKGVTHEYTHTLFDDSGWDSRDDDIAGLHGHSSRRQDHSAYQSRGHIR